MSRAVADRATSVGRKAHDRRRTVGGTEYLLTEPTLEPDELATGHRIVLCKPLDGVLASFAQAKRTFLFVGLGLTIVGLLVSEAISRRTARPIKQLTSAAHAIARGDYAVEVPERAGGEVGRAHGRTVQTANRAPA